MNNKNALISVYDKTGIVEFGQALVKLGWTIYSSGGTARKLSENGVHAIDVAELVGGGAILGHRVVTLSREVHAGLLANKLKGADIAEIEDLGIPFLGLVCVDCYPLSEEIARDGSTPASVIEQTDIGGPTMLRSAAKGRRITLCDAEDREPVIEWLKAGRPDEEDFITALVAKAETYVADYALQSGMYHGHGDYYGVIGQKAHDLRYGENPWQKSYGLFEDFGGNPDPLSLGNFEVKAGLLGHVNWTDVDRMLQTITHIAAGLEKNGLLDTYPYIAVGAKHGNACGAAANYSPEAALKGMLEGNLLSIFGGAVMTNFDIEDDEAQILAFHRSQTKRLLDVIVCSHIFDCDAAIDLLRRKNDACKILTNIELANIGIGSLDTRPLLRKVRGGFLVQDNYTFVLDLNGTDLEPETKRDLILAWAVGSTSTSNTITIVKDGKLIGNGVGQMDRVEAAELALKRAKGAGHDTKEAVAFSDSFFPFNDAPERLVDAGITTVLTASGSVNDEKVKEFFALHGLKLILIPNKEMRGFYGH